MTDRDTFAAAALTGLLSNVQRYQNEPLTRQAFEIADFMLRERCRRDGDCPGSDNAANHDAAPAAIVPEPEPEPAARRRPAGGTGGTDHGASPEARASVESVAPQPTTRGDSDRTDKAAPRPSEGTGDTQEPVAWGVAGIGGVLATSISRIDAADMQSEYEVETAIVPLYLHPPVTEPMPVEKRAEVSDRSKPITGPDPDSRVWETHTPATHATPGECSVPREGTQEPVAWAVACDYGDYGVALFSDEASAQTEADRRALVGLRPGYVVVPLYRQPTLTDAERDDICVWLAECLRQASTATEGCNEELAERWTGRAKRAAAMIERLGGGR